MKRLVKVVIVGIILVFAAGQSFAQRNLVSDANRVELNNFSALSKSNYQASRSKALSQASLRGWAVRRRTKNGNLISLQGVNKLGFPIYLITHNNTTAAATTGTNTVQPGGSTGLNLSGSSEALLNKLAIWDGGSIYTQHQEFAGKNIKIEDDVAVLDHSTHVAGTMIAKGIYAPAKGMAFNATTLHSYDFDSDVSEMSSAASGLLLSNHSYGDVAGWNYNDDEDHWEWYGLPGDSVDYTFGFYDSRAQSWDKIAYNAPYYLIVESAGNSRIYNGPALGEDYYGYKSKTDQTLVNKGPRKAGISDNGGYDIISTTGNAKNSITVGAINPLPNGPRNRSDVSISTFSSWGPTDDGRVKPDIVGDGVNVLSVGVDNTSAYLTMSGTSMAAPNITGSLYLLQEYYQQKNNGDFMRSATLKALICHTAFDAGNVGPDYIYGWGLLDMPVAAQAITDNGTKSLISENTLTQGQAKTFNVVASGNGVLSATIAWTDPQGTPTADGVINSRTPKLVNDLDIKISDGKTTFSPWVLNPDKPSANATTGNNIRDNVEQVYVANSVPGKAYTITVSHKGTLQSGSQAYSLVATGIGGTAYCVSAPLTDADSRINNFKLSNINNTPAAGCKSYSDYTTLTAQLEQAKTYPLSITLGTCGNNFNKAAKVYIDWNGNGVFDNNELAATTNVIANTGTYNTNITVPATVVPGNYSLMRVVLVETADTAVIKPCGTYAKGETQDYKVQFAQTGVDAGIESIVSPASGSCSESTAVTVKLKNFGNATISNVPVTVTIKAPDNTVTTLTDTFTGSLEPSAEGDFTLSQKFNALAGATYTITAVSDLAGDPVTSNNTATETVVINSPAIIGDLSAYYCLDTRAYHLAGSGDGTVLWYQNNTDALPIAYGDTASTTLAPSNGTFYAGINDFKGSVGPATKNVFTAGGYNQFSPAVAISTKIPVVIQSARLYIGYPGSITFNVNNSNGQVVSTTTINAQATRSNPQPGAQPDDPTDQGRVYELNLSLPAAGTYTISTVYDNSVTIYRSNGGVTGYPFKIGNVFSITGNDATSGDGSDSTYYKSFYYYFYDMQVKSIGCSSAVRKAVALTKPVITQTDATTLSSSFASGNQWYFNGAAVSGATGVTYNPLQSGNYQVAVTLSSGCTTISDSLAYARTVSNAGNATDIGLAVFPVPTSTSLNVVFKANAAAGLKLSLVNSVGQTVYTSQQALSEGNFSKVIDVSQQSPGVYVLKVLLGQKVYSQKVIVTR